MFSSNNTTTTSSSSSPLNNSSFNRDLRFQKLSDLEAYLDQYAFYNGFVIKCGRTDTKQITDYQFSIHHDNLMSSYPKRQCFKSNDSARKILVKRKSNV